MTYPPVSRPDYSYGNFEQEIAVGPFPGTQLDNDFAKVIATLGSLVGFLQKTLRSDGQLQNRAVTYDSLSDAVKLALINAPVDTIQNILADRLLNDGSNLGDPVPFRTALDAVSTEELAAVGAARALLDGSNIVTAEDRAAFRAVLDAAAKAQRGYVTPFDFGAVDDPAADNTAAWLLALATNMPVDGLGKTWSVKGLRRDTTSSTDVTWVRNATFSSLAPDLGIYNVGPANVVFFVVGPGAVVLEERVKFLRNGRSVLHSDGLVRSDQCVRIVQASYASIGCEVTGNNAGECIKLDSVKHIYFDNAYVHDCFYTNASSITDDCLEGIVMENCGSSTGSLTIARLGKTDRRAADRSVWTRGLTIDRGGPHNLTVYISDVDQGVDCSGLGYGYGRIEGTIEYCGSIGLKLVHGKAGWNASGLVIKHCGRTGVAFGGDQAGYGYNPAVYTLISGVVVRNIGTNQQWRSGVPGHADITMGISLERGNATPPFNVYPKATLIEGNVIASDQGSSAVTVATSAVDGLKRLKVADETLPVDRGVRCRLTTTGTLPGGLATGTDYYLVPYYDGAAILGLAASHYDAVDGIEVALTNAAGSGTHTLTLQSDLMYGLHADIQGSDAGLPVLWRDNAVFGAYVATSVGISKPAARARFPGASEVANATDYFPVFNDLAEGAPGFIDTATGVIKIPYDGHWTVEAYLTWSASATGGRSLGFLVDSTNKDGTAYALLGNRRTVAAIAGGDTTTSDHSVTEWFARGTLIRVVVRQTSGAVIGVPDGALKIFPASNYNATAT